MIYGVSLNNNPTVQDLWNSTPAWGFPYASSNAVVSPLAATQIDGPMAQSVAGLTAYVMWNEALYGELGAYRSAKQGVLNPITGAAGPLDGTASNVITGTAPYGRVAYEYQWQRHDLEVGVYGATFKLFPGGGTSSAPASSFKDCFFASASSSFASASTRGQWTLDPFFEALRSARRGSMK